MANALRRIYYRLYIRWLAVQWVFQVNLGDKVLHKGRVRVVSNGVHHGCWTLTDPYEQWVPRAECRKVLTPANLLGSYRSGVRFYEGYWLDIWVRDGVEPWVRGLSIWPRRKRKEQANG